MEPALKKGDGILITKDIGDLRRGDIVTYYYPGDQSQRFISRIIGLPHEEIEIRNGKFLSMEKFSKRRMLIAITTALRSIVNP